MGFVIVYGECFGCRRVIGFNPKSVPSYQNSPICKDCIVKVNAKRHQDGLREWPVPDDAYDGIPEEELQERNRREV